jgi:hypothetical protein
MSSIGIGVAGRLEAVLYRGESCREDRPEKGANGAPFDAEVDVVVRDDAGKPLGDFDLINSENRGTDTGAPNAGGRG